MRKHFGKMIASLAILISGLCANASAQNEILFVEDFVANQGSGFLFDFAALAGLSTFDANGLNIAVAPGAADNFGGVGFAPAGGQGTVDLTGLTSIEITAQANAGNTSDLIVSIRESDPDVLTGDSEFFSFTVPASAFDGGGFVTVPIDIAAGFNGDDTNPGANGVLDGLLNNTGVQTPFGGNENFDFTVQNIAFIGGPEDGGGDGGGPAVPEPGSFLALMGLGTVAALRRRRA